MFLNFAVSVFLFLSLFLSMSMPVSLISSFFISRYFSLSLFISLLSLYISVPLFFSFFFWSLSFSLVVKRASLFARLATCYSYTHTLPLFLSKSFPLPCLTAASSRPSHFPQYAHRHGRTAFRAPCRCLDSTPPKDQPPHGHVGKTRQPRL